MRSSYFLTFSIILLQSKGMFDLFSHNTPELFLIPFPIIPEQSEADSTCNHAPCELQDLIQRQ